MNRFRVHELSCYECGHRDKMTVPEAKRAGWQVWLGGGRCGDCHERREIRRRKYAAGRRTS